jgi:hypothetical protein
VEPDAGVIRGGVDPYQVAQGVDQQQAAAAVGVVRWWYPAGEGIGEVAVVVDLADQQVVFLPEGDGAAGRAVGDGVLGELGDCGCQVVGAAVG